jgi:hypothetical protein
MQYSHMVMLLVGTALSLAACVADDVQPPIGTTVPNIVELVPTRPVAIPAATPEPETPMEITIQVDADNNPGSWIHVTIDDTVVLQKVLSAGETRSYAAQRTVLVKASNAAVVSVRINGQIQRLGTTPGDVVTLACARQAVQQNSCSLQQGA